MECNIRLASESDAEDVSTVIRQALRETNAKNYPPDVIKRLERNFDRRAILDLMAKRTVFVATIDSRIVGTASLDGATVRTVFVAPDAQGQGVGKLLMATIEGTARQIGVSVLRVPSSVTAEPFYSKLGYRAVRDSYHGDERTIIMERVLRPS